MPHPVKRVAVYLRVSTQEQSAEMQRRELLAYVESRGWEVHAIYEDKGTGTNDRRPQLQELLKAARERRIDIVCCWKLDRLFRSLKGVITTLQEFSDMGVEFVSLKDQIDLSTASGRLLMHLLGAFAEFEASLIKSRVMAGLENARAKGTRLGRPPQIDPVQVQELRRQGMSLSQIAKVVGATKGAVSKSLAKSGFPNPVKKPELVGTGK